MSQDAIWIGNDHGGYETKVKVVAYLTEHGYAVNDVGSHSTDIVRYPYFAARVAGAVSRGEAQRGILICSTGIGMSIIANKFPGVRASLCSSAYDGRMTRAHNNSNILLPRRQDHGRVSGDRHSGGLAQDRVHGRQARHRPGTHRGRGASHPGERRLAAHRADALAPGMGRVVLDRDTAV